MRFLTARCTCSTGFGQDFLAKHLLGWPTDGASHDAVGDAVKSLRLYWLHQQLSADPDRLAHTQARATCAHDGMTWQGLQNNVQGFLHLTLSDRSNGTAGCNTHIGHRHALQAQLLALPREPSFATSNATFEGVCMGNRHDPCLDAVPRYMSGLPHVATCHFAACA